MSESNGALPPGTQVDITVNDQPGGSATVPAPNKLEDADILKLENFSLKIQNLKLQGERLMADYGKCGQMMKEHQAEMARFRDELSKKYAIDLTKAQISPDGTIVRAGQG